MSLNFPTAFWKKQPENAVDDYLSVDWVTGLTWSLGTGVSASEINTPLQSQSTFPFVVDSKQFNSNYNADTFWYSPLDRYDEGADPTDDPHVYFGWYLTGGYTDNGQNERDLSEVHSGNAWQVNSVNPNDATSIRFEWEADHETANALFNGEGGYPWMDESILKQSYNAFIQSGEATGTFEVSAAQAVQGDPSTGISLWVNISGLGEDLVGGDANEYNVMTLYVDDVLLASGCAPRDGDNVRDLWWNFDQQQVKLYAGDDLSSTAIVNSSRASQGKGELRGNDTELVNQWTRTIGYTTVGGMGTFSKNFLNSAGTKKIVVQFSSVDGIANSGAFYGLDFKLT
jgi:hypothetical protein